MFIVQFLYDASRVGEPMQRWLCLTLGTWHPYKQACTVVWQHWAQRIFGPLWNHLIPGANFMSKARLPSICTLLTYVRLAYPHFKRQLSSAIRTSRARVTDNEVVAFTNLVDLKKLCEYFIPVVSMNFFIETCSVSLILMKYCCIRCRTTDAC